MENNNNNRGNPDFIDRKLDGVVKIFGLTERNFMALMLTLSLLFNIVQYFDTRTTEKELHNQIVEEVRRQAVPEIRKETSNQLKPIKTELDTVISKAKERLNYK